MFLIEGFPQHRFAAANLDAVIRNVPESINPPSISHELNNRFAIVNEQAGLLKDLVPMAERSGGHPDPERLVRLADAVRKQVALGDDLLRHMNRFAHSVDVPFGETDIAGVVACVVALARRNADRRQVSLDFQLTGSGFETLSMIRR